MIQTDVDEISNSAFSPNTGETVNQSGRGAKGRKVKQQLDRILGIFVPVSVTLAEREMSVQSILNVKVGTIIEFDAPFDRELTLQVANREIGTGQAVKVGENFGLRIAKIESMQDRIGALAGNEWRMKNSE